MVELEPPGVRGLRETGHGSLTLLQQSSHRVSAAPLVVLLLFIGASQGDISVLDTVSRRPNFFVESAIAWHKTTVFCSCAHLDSTSKVCGCTTDTTVTASGTPLFQLNEDGNCRKFAGSSAAYEWWRP